MEVNKDNLEKALSKKGSEKGEILTKNKESEISFHEGALNTLAAERTELLRIVQNVEKIMQLHLSRLSEIGVNFEEKK